MPRKTPLPPELQENLIQGDLASIEDTWLTRIGEAPDDLEFFVNVAEAVAEQADDEEAQVLLEMLDEHLIESNRWKMRLDLLRQVGHLMVPPEEMHEAIMTSLSGRYAERPSFDQVVEKVGLHRATDDLPKTWQKADRLATLLAFDIGTLILMKGRGAGRVKEANMALESFNIDFFHQGDLRVGFRAAAKLLSRLPKDHILYLKIEDTERLETLRNERPSELLRLVLRSYDGPRTGAEIRADLVGLVADAQWNSWWSAARKHPQVLSSGKGRRTYSWAASSEDAQDAVWQEFEAATPRTQLALLRKDGARDDSLKKRMGQTLSQAAAAAADEEPGLACEIWYQLDRMNVAVASVPWSAPSLIESATDLRSLVRGIEERTLRERAYRQVRKQHANWPDLFAAMMIQETEPRALDLLAQALSENEGAMAAQIEQLLSQPRKAPAAFTWLVEQAAERPEWLEQNPLRLLKQLLFALSNEAFASYRTRLARMLESGGTMPRLLSALDESQAADAAEAIGKASVLADYQKRPLLNTLTLRFPSLRQDDSKVLYATPGSITRKRAELKTLLEEEIPTNRRAIEEARELGDLRENFEYKSARQRHEYLNARAAALDGELKRVRPIDPKTVTGQEVVVGARISLRGEAGERDLTILGPWESDPDSGVLSNESELAQSILGSKTGAAVTIGDDTYEIVGIAPHA